MEYIKEWRGFDIEARCKKIERCLNMQEVAEPEDFPVMLITPTYFAGTNKPRPEKYWTDPACMVAFQEKGFEKHMSLVHDDLIPYFMPWFGTGVMASAFGCNIKFDNGMENDPSVSEKCIDSIKDILHLKMPDPYKDGLMPQVLSFIDFARRYSDLPVGLTDMCSPLGTAAQMCGYENLFVWMHEEKQAVHDLLDIITQAFIEWVKIQKEHTGELMDGGNGLQGVWPPEGVGIWVSDDDLVSIGPELYEEFIVPRYSRIFKTFGGGSVHYCGKAPHQTDNLLNIENIRIVNNSSMCQYKEFGLLADKLCGKVLLQIQDGAPIDIERHYKKLFSEIKDLRGVMIATFISEQYGMDENGCLRAVDWNPFDVANRIVKIVRECVEDKLKEKS